MNWVFLEFLATILSITYPDEIVCALLERVS